MKNETLYKTICKELGLDYITAISLSHVRLMEYKDSRFFFFYLKRKISKDSLSKIGAFFEKNHATVLHGIRQVEDRMSVDYKYAESVIKLTNKVKKMVSKGGVFYDITISENTLKQIPEEIKESFISIEVS